MPPASAAEAAFSSPSSSLRVAGAEWAGGAGRGAGLGAALSARGALGAASAWNYSNANLTFLNDHKYTVTARAADNATNFATLSKSFFYDVQTPTAAVTSPVNNQRLITWTQITGTASDNPSGTLSFAAGLRAQEPAVQPAASSATSSQQAAPAVESSACS